MVVHVDRRGLVVGLATFVLWGLLTVYWKALRGFDAFELIGHRIVWSSVLLAVVTIIGHRAGAVLRALRTPRLAGRLALASILLAGNWTSYVYAVVHGRVVETALGYFIAPVGTMVLGVAVLGEHLRPRQRIALALAVVAVVVLTVSYGRVPWLALGMAATWCGYGFLKKNVPLGPLESLAGETWLLVIPAAAIVAIHQRAGDGVAATGTTFQIVLVLLTGVVTAVPLTLFAYAAKRLPLTVIGPMQYAVPTINFLLGVFAYHEPLDGTRVAGFALVWAALGLLTLDSLVARRATTRDLVSVP